MSSRRHGLGGFLFPQAMLGGRQRLRHYRFLTHTEKPPILRTQTAHKRSGGSAPASWLKSSNRVLLPRQFRLEYSHAPPLPIQPENTVMEENPYQPPESEETASPVLRKSSVVWNWIILAIVVAMIIGLLLPALQPAKQSTNPRRIDNSGNASQSSHP